MKLPSLPFFKKAVTKEYFLALLLQDENIHAVVFEENNGIIHSLGEGEHLLLAPIDDISGEELLTAVDHAISTAETSLPANAQSHKTIFGVKEDWTADLQIDKDHLTTLKKLCDELDLEPIGFLVFAEAIAHLLQKEEGAPVSGVLVEIGTKHIRATLLRAGRILSSRQAPVEDNLPKAVDTLLMQFSDAEILPSRIILFDNHKRKQLAQQFTNHTWSKQLPFLHVPQVTPLVDGFITQAVLFGTATQMGFDMLGLPEVKKGSTEKEEESEVVTENTQAEPEAQIEPEPEPSPSGENFGFVKDTDVLETAPKNPIAFDNLKLPDDESEEEFAAETFANIPEEVKEDEERHGAQITAGVTKVLGKLKKIKFTSLIPSGISTPSTSRKMLFAAPVLLFLIIASILWYIFGVKATATLLINPKEVKASQGVTFSSTSGTDMSSDTIGGTIIPITENGNASTQATGSQDVGDKAKGTVTIYNNDSNSHSIDAGTTLTSSNGLTFITNIGVTVASASGDIFSGTQPGTQTVDVTATDIGTQYNLPSGTKFAIGNSSVIAAKNDSAFSGGTKKTVTVVAQKDLDKLTSDLTKTLGDKAKQDAQNSGNGKVVLATFLSTDTSNQKFDKKAGDQASSVSLSGTVTYSALAYNKKDLDTLALSIIQANNQSESISQDTVSQSIDDAKVADDNKSISTTLNIKAGLLPKIDTSKVAASLAGKPFIRSLDALSDIPQLNSVHAVLSPNLFFLPKTFPHIASHISVEVKANE